MAIIIEEEQKNIPWFPIIIGLLIVGALGAATYYLFFAPTPVIDIVLPPALQSAEQLSTIDIDPTSVINSRLFRSLRVYTGLPSVGELGKANPFLP